MGEEHMAPRAILIAAFWMMSSLAKMEGAAEPYMLLPYLSLAWMVA